MDKLRKVILFDRNIVKQRLNWVIRSKATTSAEENPREYTDDEFRVLDLRKIKQKVVKRREFKKVEVPPPRTNKMATDQDWTAVWPGPRSFHPASVPLPIRQGYKEKDAPPSKYANAELMKIPNFLHLTPPAIKQQCEALKRFCTPWPQAIDTEAKWKEHFPINITTADYCQALPTLRNPEARRVKLTLKLSALEFNAHAKDKFLRLVGERYNSTTDDLTIIAERCPLRKQNYDYAMYLLTACYHESFITENWEATKSNADMECYSYENNKSKESVEAILNWKKEDKDNKMAKVTAPEEFIESVECLINDGENQYNLNKYKKAVVDMLINK